MGPQPFPELLYINQYRSTKADYGARFEHRVPVYLYRPSQIDGRIVVLNEVVELHQRR